MNLNLWYFLISQNISADLKGPKVKYKLHYGRCTGPLFRDATRHNTSCSDNKWKYNYEFLQEQRRHSKERKWTIQRFRILNAHQWSYTPGKNSQSKLLKFNGIGKLWYEKLHGVTKNQPHIAYLSIYFFIFLSLQTNFLWKCYNLWWLPPGVCELCSLLAIFYFVIDIKVHLDKFLLLEWEVIG